MQLRFQRGWHRVSYVRSSKDFFCSAAAPPRPRSAGTSPYFFPPDEDSVKYRDVSMDALKRLANHELRRTGTLSCLREKTPVCAMLASRAHVRVVREGMCLRGGRDEPYFIPPQSPLSACNGPPSSL